MDEIIRIGIAEMGITDNLKILKTAGLGSCVGVVIFDSKNKIAGMVHVMLPHVLATDKGVSNKSKFADTAVPLLIQELVNKGAVASRLRAKIAGGASMFPFSTNSSLIKVGPRNIESVKSQLAHHRIPILAEDTGGNKGRTIEYHADTFLLYIRTATEGTKVI